jgi:hypothetical protein
MTIFLVVGSFAVEGRLSLFCGGGVTALGAMMIVWGNGLWIGEEV